MNFKIISIIILLIFNFQNIFSGSCGGNITCNCGDTLIYNYNLTSDLNCNLTALNFNSNIKLNCQNYNILGSGGGNGLIIDAKDNIEIKNCNIKNFNRGIFIKSNYVWYNFGYVYRWLLKDSLNNNIFNNRFENNNWGIYTQNDKQTKIHKNIFKNNSKNSIYLRGRSTNIIWENIFYDSGIYFQKTSGKSFCNNNISNIFYNTSIKQECNCIKPINGLTIDSKVNFCKGEYFFIDGLKFKSGANLNCFGSKIYGEGVGTGILVRGSKTKINNCIISNYSNGVSYYPYILYDANHYRYNAPSSLNSISNSKIYNVKNGIVSSSFKHFSSWLDSWTSDLNNNEIIASKYNLYDNNYGIISAKNNYWGSNNKTIIESKFLKPNNVQYLPYIKKIGIDYSLNIKDLILREDKLIFKINKSNEFNFENIEIEIIKIENNSIINDSYFNISNKYSNEILVILNYSINYSQEIFIILDPNNKILDINRNNNYIHKFFIKKSLIYINSNLNFKFLNNDLIFYLKYKIGENDFTNNLSKAQIIINISENKQTIFNLNDKFNYNLNYFKYPYEGSIISNLINNKTIINLVGTDIDGSLSTIKFFSNNYHLFLNKNINNTNYTFLINSSNLKAIKIYDYLHNTENNIYYKENNNKFREIINNILYDNFYKIIIKKIPIIINNNSINYSLKILKPNFSFNFKKYIDNDSYPLIFSGGLWSNINAWENTGKRFANLGYEVYFIELTGGNLECPVCYNYNYSNLINIVYPKYFNFILNLSKSKKVKIIGHSNGARVPIDSISKNNLNSSKIDTFIAVGIPGSFENLSYFGKLLNSSGNKALIKMKNKNITHISFSRIAHELDSNIAELFSALSYLFTNENKISINLLRKYILWINSTKDLEPKLNNNHNISYFTLIYGNYKNLGNDLIVSNIDSKNIFKNINSENKVLIEVNSKHIGMTDDNNIFNLIFNSLNKEIYKNKSSNRGLN